MEYKVYDPQTKLTTTMPFEGIKTKLCSWSTQQTRENHEALWQIEPNGTAEIMGYTITRIK